MIINLPRALETSEIREIIKDFVKVANNAIEAGFVGVEIHGAKGFLTNQFLNTSSNKSTGIYGGSIPNRARFMLQILNAVISDIGPKKTAIRFSPVN